MREETMFNIDWNRLQPLRVAKGSHTKGSGHGCAMNVVSYITGETHITDYPSCSATILSQLVQMVNDQLAPPTKTEVVTLATLGASLKSALLVGQSPSFLSPEDAITAIELGVATIGTGSADDSVLFEWTANALDAPGWGLISRTGDAYESELRSVADLYRRAARGDTPLSEWKAKYEAVFDFEPESTAEDAVDSALWMAVGWVPGNEALMNSAHLASISAVRGAHSGVGETVDCVRSAIQSWRDLQGLDAPAAVDQSVLQSVLIGVGE